MLDSFLYYYSKKYKNVTDKSFINDIPVDQAVRFLARSTYLQYDKLLHKFTFQNLPKEIQNDLLLLDESVAHDEKYLGDHVFLYERFKDGTSLSNGDKDLIVNNIYSRMYYKGAKRIKNSVLEKDGFLLHAYFAELPIKELFQKLIDEGFGKNRKKDADMEGNVLSLAAEYAESQNISIEKLIKEKLLEWLDNGLFISEFLPLSMSDRFDTWNGNTKKKHSELFMVWYAELRKSELYFQKLFDTNRLQKKKIKKDFLGMPRMIEVVTGDSLYACTENADFVTAYRKQIEILLPASNIFLFIEKYASPLKNNKTLREFKNLAQKVSSVFEIDMTASYAEFINSYQEEVRLLNLSLIRIVGMATESLYIESMQYIVDIDENCFTFDLAIDDKTVVANIANKYGDEFKELNM